MKTYFEIKVPISFDAPWFCELREALKNIPVHWQNGYYHITMVFIDDTSSLSEIEAIMHKHLDNAHTVTMTFNKLDVFNTYSGMQIVHLTTDNTPEEFQRLVNNIRHDIGSTSSIIESDFKLHVTLGRITEREVDMEDVGFLIDEIDFTPITLTLNEVEYRVFRGRSIYKKLLK